ncbi:hypothetical protein BpHYR1_015179, partial [Brachionus plicatilis]
LQYKLKLTCTHFVLQLFLGSSSTFSFSTFPLGRVEEELRKGNVQVKKQTELDLNEFRVGILRELI